MAGPRFRRAPPRHAHGDLTSLAPHERLPDREPLLEPGVGTGLTGCPWWKWATRQERARDGAIPGGVSSSTQFSKREESGRASEVLCSYGIWGFFWILPGKYQPGCLAPEFFVEDKTLLLAYPNLLCWEEPPSQAWGHPAFKLRTKQLCQCLWCRLSPRLTPPPLGRGEDARGL